MNYYYYTGAECDPTLHYYFWIKRPINSLIVTNV